MDAPTHLPPPPPSTDEPSTGACAGEHRSIGFWCAVELRLVPSARVDDGLADCCDGSDEWQLKVALG